MMLEPEEEVETQRSCDVFSYGDNLSEALILNSSNRNDDSESFSEEQNRPVRPRSPDASES